MTARTRIAGTVAAVVLLAATGAFADDDLGYGVAPTGPIGARKPAIPAPPPPAMPAMPAFVPFEDEAPAAPDAPPAGEVPILDETAPEPPIIEVIEGEEPPVVVEEVPPAIEVVPPPSAVDGYDLPSAWPPAKQRRLVRRPRMSFRVHAEGALSILEDPEGGLGAAVSGGATPYDWSSNEYDPEFGGRLGLSWTPGDCYRYELRGTYYGSWEANSTQNGSFGFRPPATGTSPAATATFASEAELYSAEANFWHEFKENECLCLQAGIGFRYVMFEDEASVAGLPIPGAAPIGTVTGVVENEFFGGQIMVGGVYTPSSMPGLSLDVSIKGLLGSLDRRIRVNDDSVLAGGPHSSSREQDDFAWGAEARIGVSYAISRCVRITAAYELLYLADISRAHESLDFTQAATGAVQAGDTTDNLIVHSLFVGVRFDF